MHIKWEPWKNALNKLKCNLGNIVVDSQYSDGEEHMFTIKDNYVYYQSRSTKPKVYRGDGAMSGYICTDKDIVYANEFVERRN